MWQQSPSGLPAQVWVWPALAVRPPSTQPASSTLAPRERCLRVESQNAPGSKARFVSLKTNRKKKKKPNKQHTWGVERETLFIFPVIRVGITATVLALPKSKKEETRFSLPSLMIQQAQGRRNSGSVSVLILVPGSLHGPGQKA